MPFDPFGNKNARSIVAKISKGKTIIPLKKLFENVVAVRASGNLDVNAINNQTCEECLAAAEIVAAGRGNGGTKVKLPAEAAQWLSTDLTWKMISRRVERPLISLAQMALPASFAMPNNERL